MKKESYFSKMPSSFFGREYLPRAITSFPSYYIISADFGEILMHLTPEYDIPIP
jgi:hypothetical protein